MVVWLSNKCGWRVGFKFELFISSRQSTSQSTLEDKIQRMLLLTNWLWDEFLENVFRKRQAGDTLYPGWGEDLGFGGNFHNFLFFLAADDDERDRILRISLFTNWLMLNSQESGHWQLSSCEKHWCWWWWWCLSTIMIIIKLMLAMTISFSHQRDLKNAKDKQKTFKPFFKKVGFSTLSNIYFFTRRFGKYISWKGMLSLVDPFNPNQKKRATLRPFGLYPPLWQWIKAEEKIQMSQS